MIFIYKKQNQLFANRFIMAFVTLIYLIDYIEIFYFSFVFIKILYLPIIFTDNVAF